MKSLFRIGPPSSVSFFAAILLLACCAADVAAEQNSASQSSSAPLLARDGDTIVVEDGARLNIIHRRHARVRAIFNANQHWLLLLASYPRKDEPAVLQVDETFTFNDVQGDWPFAPRWEGDAIIERYSVADGRMGPRGTGFGTPQGIVQLFGADDPNAFRDPSALSVLSYRGFGGGGARGNFDAVEQMQTAVANRNAEQKTGLPAGAQVTAGVSGGLGFVATQSGGSFDVAPVRVGGSVPPPRRIHDVPPVLPMAARQAGVIGTVVVELTIGVDGAVSNARILRSIPLLDSAALDCVRQWRYDPVVLNGKPVPAILTATVVFP